MSALTGAVSAFTGAVLPEVESVAAVLGGGIVVDTGLGTLRRCRN